MEDDSSSTSSTTEPSCVGESPAITKVREHFACVASGALLHDVESGNDTLDALDEIEDEIERLLDQEETGEAGPRFRETSEYRDGRARLRALREQHADVARQTESGIPRETDDVTTTSPLGHYAPLFDCIGDAVLKDERIFRG